MRWEGLVLYRKASHQKNPNGGDKMALNKPAFFFSFFWTSGACFHCQEGEPGKELDLAKQLGEYGKGVEGPRPELKNGGGIIKSPTVKTTLYNDHLTLLFAEGCYSQLLPLNGNFGLPLLADSADRCLTFKQKYCEVEGEGYK